MNDAWSENLKCFFRCWRVASDVWLILELPNNSICSMSGCIKTAKYLLPKVRRITVYVEEIIEIEYAITLDGRWNVV